MNESEKRAYDSYLKDLSYEASMLDTRFIEGKAEGEMLGEARGEAKGKAEIVLNMVQKGYSPEDISELTGISVERVREIISESIC